MADDRDPGAVYTCWHQSSRVWNKIVEDCSMMLETGLAAPMDQGIVR